MQRYNVPRQDTFKGYSAEPLAGPSKLPTSDLGSAIAFFNTLILLLFGYEVVSSLIDKLSMYNILHAGRRTALTSLTLRISVWTKE
jgi:hypothetical protein